MNAFSREKAAEILKAQGHEACVQYCVSFGEGNDRDSDALAYLGSVYHYAQGEKRDLEKAEACYREAVRGGSAAGRTGLLHLGCAYMHVVDTEQSMRLGTVDGFPLDLEKAEQIIKFCHQTGGELSPEIQQLYVWLGDYYRYGWDDTTRSTDKALELYGLVADSDNKDILLQYADFMATREVGKEAAAYECYQRLAGQGYAPAMLKLSDFILDDGEIRAVFDADRAIKCLKRAVIIMALSLLPLTLGYVDFAYISERWAVQFPAWAGPVFRVLGVAGRLSFGAAILYAIISIYLSVAQTHRKQALCVGLLALAYYGCLKFIFDILEDAGMSASVLENIRYFLFFGVLIAAYFIRVIRCSVEWIKKAADTGDAEAIHILAGRYYFGIGVKKNSDEAIRMYKRAAQKGYNRARFVLGYAYRFGRGVEKDYDKAYQYFMEAAEAGDADSQYMIGYCYENGISKLQDIDEAIKWYQKGKANGSRLAKDRLNKPLTPTLRDHLRGTIPSYSEVETLRRAHEAVVKAKDEQISFLKSENAKKDEQLAAERKRNEILDRQITRNIDELREKIESLSDTLTDQKNTLIAVIRREGDHVTEAVEKQFAVYCQQVQDAMVRSAGDEQNQTLYQKQEQKLKYKFGDCWERMLPESRISLTSGRTMFEVVPQLTRGADFDYSGVCICTTAALEAELSHYFLKKYIKHVEQKTSDLTKWPSALTYWDYNARTWKKKTRFLLGDLNELLDLSNGGEDLAEHLQNILKEEYFDREEPTKWLTQKRLPDGSCLKRSFVSQVAMIRDQYRNPSAHSIPVGFDKALNCMESIMGPVEAENRLNMTESILYCLLNMVK